MVSIDDLTVNARGRVHGPDGREIYIERDGVWWTELAPQWPCYNMRPMLGSDLERLRRIAKANGEGE